MKQLMEQHGGFLVLFQITNILNTLGSVKYCGNEKENI